MSEQSKIQMKTPFLLQFASSDQSPKCQPERHLTKPRSAVLALGLLMAVALMGTPQTGKAQAVWSGLVTPGDWNTGANWTGGNAPGTSDVASFSTNNGNQIIRLTIPNTQVAGLVFSNTGTTTIQGDGTNRTLSLGSAGITINAGAGAVNLGLSNPNGVGLTLTANQTWTNNSSNTLTKGNRVGISFGGFVLTIGGTGNTTSATSLSGAGGSVIKTGTGTLSLTGGSSSYTGTTTVSGGSMLISGATDINGTSRLSVASGVTFTNNSTTAAFTKSLTLAEGAIIRGTNGFTPTSISLTGDLSGALFTTFALGTTSLTKAGAFDLTLSNINVGTYSVFSGSSIGGTFGTLVVNGTGLSDIGSGNFSGSVGGFGYTFTNATNQLSVIPEPRAWALMAVGLFALIVMRRRRIAQS